MVVVTQKENGMDNMVFRLTRKLCKEMKMQYFHFDESYAMRSRKHFIIPICTMSQNLKTHQYQYSQKMSKESVHQCTIHAPPRTMRGKFFRNLKPKNAKNHAILLLQMQGCPQYNIKQEIKYFCFKNFTKSNNELC
jgi:hypothetical protein